MNLPNAITVTRMAAAPLIGVLPFVSSAGVRFLAFGLYIVAAVSDYYDGRIARSRNAETDLGRLLDPAADKLLLAATLIPMAILMAPPENWLAPLIDRTGQASQFAFVTPVCDISLPWWLVLIVLSREIFMTVFRQQASRRGYIIAAIGPAKWKTAFQAMWAGAAFFWFGASTLATQQGWNHQIAWRILENVTGIFGAFSMFGAVALTLYSLWLYLRHYRHVFVN